VFDKKKLEAFLDALEVETHYPSKPPKKIVPAPRSALDQKMDKYDIFRQGDYQNMGTPEFPIWAKPNMNDAIDVYSYFYKMPMTTPVWATYGGIQRGSFPIQGFDDDTPKIPPQPIETAYQKLQKRIAQLQTVEPVKIENPKPAPPMPQKSPDYVGTITAWRGWGICAGQLVALGHDYDWAPKHAQKAKCQHESHQAPQLDCSCGFWSFKTLELLTKALERYEECSVIGQVEIWGRVIECQNGWRSEYAYPKELWLLDEEGTEHLSWTYGVPVRRHVPCRALVKTGPKAIAKWNARS
jgi:hypothetical protein